MGCSINVLDLVGFDSSVSFLIFCLVVQSVVMSRVLKFLTVIAAVSVSPRGLSVFASHILQR